MYQDFPSRYGEFTIDDETSRILIGLQNFLYPKVGVPPLSYKEVLSIAIASAPSTEWALWDAIIHGTGIMPQSYEFLDRIVTCVFNFYREQKIPELAFLLPNDHELACINALLDVVRASVDVADDQLLDHMTSAVYECGKKYYLTDTMRNTLANGVEASGMTEKEFQAVFKESQKYLRNFFAMTYMFCLGQEDGPRLPVFILMIGRDRFINLVEMRLFALQDYYNTSEGRYCCYGRNVI